MDKSRTKKKLHSKDTIMNLGMNETYPFEELKEFTVRSLLPTFPPPTMYLRLTFAYEIFFLTKSGISMVRFGFLMHENDKINQELMKERRFLKVMENGYVMLRFASNFYATIRRKKVKSDVKPLNVV